ncbi:hypothetical protein [Stackebrandtia nassauensis]|uniref:Uncharacterized protein n=1 Tax=Stackebrandtia nassauensis (strain DSM 44728 / CIP 108903 / NRRL B-16338 / NBRC 102104 / LLR-40K-21) TaxID=446470 RepID=D3PVS4_STANL|nr:hypothetical protein [Stackebrandtia nassauensis]ADD45045.1 hypothetical protein Snas_5413 [Stackebrandtia nassauensis DSM 44728]
MNGIAVLAVILFVVIGGPSWILSIFSPAYRKRRRESRAKTANKAWGLLALAGTIALIGLAGLDYIGLIEIK